LRRGRGIRRRGIRRGRRRGIRRRGRHIRRRGIRARHIRRRGSRRSRSRSNRVYPMRQLIISRKGLRTSRFRIILPHAYCNAKLNQKRRAQAILI
jgi:hypothetical protein